MMQPAPSRAHIKRRLDDYLWRDNSLPLVRLRSLLRAQFLPVGPVAIIGGLIRDLAQSGPEGFKSDVDLVFDVEPSAVAALASRLGATPNRFGGFGFHSEQWKIDFWALRSTWAGVNGHVKIRKLHDLLRCTFFTSDAILYRLDEKKLVADEKYVCDMYLRRLEINLLPNPSPDGNLVRATRRLLSKNMSAGPKLKSFLRSEINEKSFCRLVETEKRLYGYSYGAAYQCSEALLEALINRQRRRNHEHGLASQYSLPI